MWSSAVASPDGRHLYAISNAADELVVLTAGFKGIGRPDRDGDGVEDILDVFPDDPEEWLDTDGDTIGNNADPDDDDDGVADESDAFPQNDSEWLDTDGDNIGNNADPDDDNDGYDDAADAFPLRAEEWSDADGDGKGDNEDLDDDNDGMSDLWEEANGLNPLDASDASLNPDGDNLTNLEEFENDSDINLQDTDGDGYLDHEDQMPRDPTEYRDIDGDGIGDTADLDDDNDGLSDQCETTYGFDPLVANPEGRDFDGDGVADDLECIAGTDPTKTDTDGDGLPDDFELAYGLDALSNDASEDLDQDGYSNELEYQLGHDPSVNEFDDRSPELIERLNLPATVSTIQVASHPGGENVVVAVGKELIVYARDAITGRLTQLSQFVISTTFNSLNTLDLTFSGDDLYVVTRENGFDIDEQALHHLKLDASGTLVAQRSLTLEALGSGAVMEAGVAYESASLSYASIEASPDGEQVYLGVRSRGVLIFDRDDTTGDFTFREHFLNGESYLHAHTQLVMSDSG
ncbi:hypothetical protein QLQ17_17125, partial [Marinobacter sp. CHS3-4]|nr:hypothetical protein [Marinobacter sp. CHS3-4]